jgi:hypothetical protein
MNATDFFEKTRGDRSLPSSPESFWIAFFALFVLHLASHEREGALTAWQPTSQQGPPWYERKAGSAALRVRGVTFERLAVEPQTVMEIWPEIIQDISLGGIAPDVVLRVPGDEGSNPGYALIENKITSGATLNANQLTAYPGVVSRLCDAGLDARLFVLQPVGCSQRLYAVTKSLQRSLGDRFAILLWEDVFRVMERTRFPLLAWIPHGCGTSWTMPRPTAANGKCSKA